MKAWSVTVSVDGAWSVTRFEDYSRFIFPIVLLSADDLWEDEAQFRHQVMEYAECEFTDVWRITMIICQWMPPTTDHGVNVIHKQCVWEYYQHLFHNSCTFQHCNHTLLDGYSFGNHPFQHSGIQCLHSFVWSQTNFTLLWQTPYNDCESLSAVLSVILWGIVRYCEVLSGILWGIVRYCEVLCGLHVDHCWAVE